LRRVLCLLALILPLVACGSPTRIASPFSLEDGAETGGWSVLQLGPSGTLLRFVPNTRFGLGIILRSRAKSRVTLVDVRTVDPPNSLVHNDGTVLRRWDPPPCSGGHSCPAVGFLHGPYRATTPRPIVVRPGAQAAVQLDFHVDACSAVPTASAAAAQKIVVTYEANGRIGRQLISLRSQRMRMRMPSARDCEPRPKSSISVSAPFSSGSDSTIPVSSGDSCSRTTNGGLLFTSRLYQTPNQPAVRIDIHLPRFRGLGLYRTLENPASSRGPALVRAVVGIGITGWKTFPSTTAVVTVISLSAHTAKGRFHATFSGRRHSEVFRAFGAWRCLIA
jgi:hypothetical protein